MLPSTRPHLVFRCAQGLDSEPQATVEIRVGPCVPRYLREAVQPSGSLCGPWSQGAWVQLLGSVSLASYFGSLCLSLLICEMGLKAGAQLAESINLVHEALCHFVLPQWGGVFPLEVSPQRPPPQSGLP